MSDFETAITCPFCGSDGFNAWHLKKHLLHGWCEAFEACGNSTERPQEKETP